MNSLTRILPTPHRHDKGRPRIYILTVRLGSVALSLAWGRR